jgi:hypothetical protein
VVAINFGWVSIQPEVFTFTVAIKRAYLRSVYATLGGVTLLAALAAKSIAAATVIESGQVVRSTSSSDVSVEFAEPGKGAPTPSEMVEMWESLLDDYDLAVYYLNQDGIASPTDTQIYNKMVAVVLIAATTFGGDFSNFRREASYRGMS